jgi:uncharacterized protein
MIEGPVAQWGKPVVLGLEEAMHGGFYAASRGKFQFNYPYSEHVTVVEGVVTLINASHDQRVTYRKGDSWIIEKNSPIIWDIQSDRVVMSYLGMS